MPKTPKRPKQSKRYKYLCIGFLLLSTTFGFAQATKNGADSLYNRGKKEYRKAKFQDAIRTFEVALAMYQQLDSVGIEGQFKSNYRIAACYGELRENKKALSIIEATLQEVENQTSKNKDLEADLWNQHGTILHQMFRSDEAEASYRKAIALYEAEYGYYSSNVGNMYMNIGNSLAKRSRFMESEKYHLQALEIFKKSAAPESADFNRIYNNLGVAYRKLGRHEKAQRYAKRALEIKLKNYDAFHPSVSKYYANIGHLYRDIEDYQVAIKYYQKAAEIQEKNFGKKHRKTASIYGNIAICYDLMGKKNKALRMYKKVYAIGKESASPNHPFVLSAYYNMGCVYADLTNYEKAEKIFLEITDILKKNEVNSPELLVELHYALADIFINKKMYDTALDFCQKGMVELVPGFEKVSSDIFKNPSSKTIQLEEHFITLLQKKAHIFEALGTTYFLDTTQQEESSKGVFYLKKALETLDYALNFLEKSQKRHQSEKTRLVLNSNSETLYKQGVRLCFLLYKTSEEKQYLWQALNYMDKSRAAVMRLNLNEAYATQSANIPAEILMHMDKLGVEISARAYQTNQNDSTQRRYFDLQEEYEKIITDLEVSYPDYYALKYASKNINKETLQQRLQSDNSTALCYLTSDKTLYALMVTGTDIRAAETAFGAHEKEAISTLRSFDPNSLFSVKRDSINTVYFSALHQLHKTLVAPFQTMLAAHKNIHILPYGSLHYVPFEALTPSAENYLVLRHAIFYQWSLALWLDERKQASKNKNLLACFAPVFEQKPQFADNQITERMFRNRTVELPFSKQECTTALRYFKGDSFFEHAATEANFKSKAPTYSILHLATHAEANDQNPMLSGLFFSEKDSVQDGFLHLYELYQLELNADMAVLSACNTGTGAVAKGEGLISMGRGFRYAGCPSVIMSQWLANDHATATIMAYFYENLHTGLPKNIALQQAKIRYIEEADVLTGHPYYWAAMMGMGDAAALDLADFSWRWLLIIGIVLLLVIGRYVFKQSQQSSN